jgi:probable F420-dependent oxidoreductase
MNGPRWALSVPIENFSLREIAEIARDAEEMGYADAWSGEVDGVDAFTPLAMISSATRTMRLGTAIANIYTRGPQALAASAAALADVAPGRFLLGLGAGSVNIVERWNGGSFVRPVTRMREMVQVLRAALAGERVVFNGDAVTVNGYRLSAPPATPVPIHVAALKPKMLAVAGGYGDGVLLNFLSAADVAQSVAVARKAAADAGRDPAALEVTARLFVSLDRPGRETDEVLRRWIAGYLTVPTYRAFQDWLGRGPMLQPMYEAWAAGDRRAALEVIPEQVLRDLFLVGSPEERRAQLARYFEGGLQTAALMFFTSEPDVARRRELFIQAVKDMSPRASGA